jgi:mono/diheme cytochrome c family protein
MITLISAFSVVALGLAAAPPAAFELARRAAPAHSKQVDWTQLRKDVVQETRFDVQLGRVIVVRGISLDALLARGPARADEDTALLHFANGMMVPVPLDAKGKAEIDVFIAHERQREQDGAFVSSFLPVIHQRSSWMEQRAIVFSDNKVVVSQGDHPSLPTTTTKFSPWSHVDSLRRVELVRAADVHKALDVSPEKDIRRGLAVFEQRCQYCHGVNGKGASFGWDFVAPIPLSTWRDAESLLYHVKMSKLDAANRGLMMPPQPDVTLEEMQALWSWMDAIGRSGAERPGAR